MGGNAGAHDLLRRVWPSELGWLAGPPTPPPPLGGRGRGLSGRRARTGRHGGGAAGWRLQYKIYKLDNGRRAENLQRQQSTRHAAVARRPDADADVICARRPRARARDACSLLGKSSARAVRPFLLDESLVCSRVNVYKISKESSVLSAAVSLFFRRFIRFIYLRLSVSVSSSGFS